MMVNENDGKGQQLLPSKSPFHKGNKAKPALTAAPCEKDPKDFFDWLLIVNQCVVQLAKSFSCTKRNRASLRGWRGEGGLGLRAPHT